MHVCDMTHPFAYAQWLCQLTLCCVVLQCMCCRVCVAVGVVLCSSVCGVKCVLQWVQCVCCSVCVAVGCCSVCVAECVMEWAVAVCVLQRVCCSGLL